MKSLFAIFSILISQSLCAENPPSDFVANWRFLAKTFDHETAFLLFEKQYNNHSDLILLSRSSDRGKFSVTIPKIADKTVGVYATKNQLSPNSMSIVDACWDSDEEIFKITLNYYLISLNSDIAKDLRIPISCDLNGKVTIPPKAAWKLK